MEIKFKSQKLSPIKISEYELGWKMEDVLMVLEYYCETNQVVLGGDVIKYDLEPNYDNWYYNVDKSKNKQYNVFKSVEKAKAYISNYIERNGTNYYVVITI